MLSMLPGGLFELVGAALGAHFGGLTGLSFGWIVTIYIEAFFMFSTVYRVVRPVMSSSRVEQVTAEMDAIWLLETAIQPSIGQGYAGAEALWLEDTSKLLAVKRGYKEGMSRLKPPKLERYMPLANCDT